MIVENWLSDIIFRIIKMITGKNYGSITLFIFIFIQRGSRSRSDWEITLNHEQIHIVQQLEIILAATILFILFQVFVFVSHWWVFLSDIVPFVIYIIDYLWHRIKMRFSHNKSYRRTRFEREAYAHEEDLNYLQGRKPFRWVLNNP